MINKYKGIMITSALQGGDQKQNITGHQPRKGEIIMSHVNIWVHAIWATKGRRPLLLKEIRRDVFDHIKTNAKSKNIHVDFVNGFLEHIHCTISLNADQNIANVINLIKGESSYWINKYRLTKSRFEWQDEYMALSVSDRGINNVREYIKNQEAHHQVVTYKEEYQKFIRDYNLLD